MDFRGPSVTLIGVIMASGMFMGVVFSSLQPVMP